MLEELRYLVYLDDQLIAGFVDDIPANMYCSELERDNPKCLVWINDLQEQRKISYASDYEMSSKSIEEKILNNLKKKC